MRKTLTLVVFLALPAVAQIQGGNETVQDAIRWERHKDAAAARQARIESRRAVSSSAERSTVSSKTTRTTRSKKGSAARSETNQTEKTQTTRPETYK